MKNHETKPQEYEIETEGAEIGMREYDQEMIDENHET